MRRIGFVLRKGTKAARKLPFDYEKQKLDFLSCVRDTCEKFAILEEMVINFDQTNISIIPCGNWTMAEQGRLYQNHFELVTDERTFGHFRDFPTSVDQDRSAH